jgi:hypothetical protein
MPERWKQELGRLNEIEAPLERIRGSASRGSSGPSHGDGLPPTKQRITAAVVATVVFLAAGAFAWQAFRPEERHGVIGGDAGVEVTQLIFDLRVDERDGLSYPTATMNVGDSTIEGAVTTLSWENTIFDYPQPEPFSPQDFVTINLPASLVVKGDARDANFRLHRPGPDPEPFWSGDGVDLGWMHDQPIDLGSETGRFVIEVRAKWPQGNPSFYFPVELVGGGETVAPLEDTATISFIAKNAPEAILTYGGDQQKAERPEYDWCDTAGCVSGIGDYVHYPPVSTFIDVPAGTALNLAGSNLTAIKGGFRTMDGDKASEVFEDPQHLGTIPMEEGNFALELHVGLDSQDGEHGSATFWFGVRSIPGSGTSPTGVSDVLRVSCSASGTEVLTPVVEAQPDGVRVVVAADAPFVSLEFHELERSDGSDPIEGFGGPFRPSDPKPWPIAPGRAEVMCAGNGYGESDATPPSFEVVDPNGYWLPGTMECAEGDPAVAVVSYDGGAADYPSKNDAIRALLNGVDAGDEVGMPFYRGSKDARFVIDRDGSVVGTVWIGITDDEDPRGRGLTKVTGEVCGSSGIEGNVPPHDPDEDGVALDCRAPAQIAFDAPAKLLAVPGPAGPTTAIDLIVKGVANADEIVLEQPIGGDGEGTYVIIRHGIRLGSVRFPELDGIACRWSGIGGV